MADTIDAAAVRDRLAGTTFADVEWVSETGSTNADLLARARTGAAEGLVLGADHQTAGRGRLGRVWEAPPGSSLLLSVLFRPRFPPGDAHLIATALGLAAAQAITLVAGVDAALKWPNDLVVPTPGAVNGYLKLAGILSEVLTGHSLLRSGAAPESPTGRDHPDHPDQLDHPDLTVRPDHVDAIIGGIGINVNWPDELPAELAGIAVSVNHLAGRETDRGDLLVELLSALDRWYLAAMTTAGRAGLLAAYRGRSATIGRFVRVETAANVVEGEAVDITSAGHLLVDERGTLREIVAGDVVHLR